MQKYGLFSTCIDTRNSMTLVQMLPLKANDRQGYYLASEADAKFAELERAYSRYEKLRKLNPRQFKALWDRCLKEDVKFDDAVDALAIAL